MKCISKAMAFVDLCPRSSSFGMSALDMVVLAIYPSRRRIAMDRQREGEKKEANEGGSRSNYLAVQQEDKRVRLETSHRSGCT